MLGDRESKREFYESQNKGQLIIFLLNKDYENERLRKKLNLLTGCPYYGDHDSMNGSCVDCHYETPELQMECSKFQNKLIKTLKEESQAHD